VTTTSPLANWNGQEMPLDQVKVSVLDRAFLFGDAIYEVMRVYHGKLWRLEEHLQRLESGLAMLKIEIDHRVLRQRVTETVEHSRLQEALVYIQITRGEATPRTHRFPANAVANQLIYIEEFGDPFLNYRKSGAKTITQPDIRWSRNDIKATSMLANCILAQAAAENGCLETIMIDAQGIVTEGSHSSIFAVKNGEILLSPDSPQVLPGITKKQIMELSHKCAIPLRTHRLRHSELEEVDELFLTATPEEIIPIIQVDDYKIKDGIPGQITRKLQAAFAELITASL